MNRSLVMLSSAICIMSTIATADIFMKQQTTTVSGKKEKTTTEETTVWIAEDKMVSQGTESTMIVRLDKDVAWAIDTKKKTYVEIPLSTLIPTDGSNEQQEAAAALPGMFANMLKMKVTVEPTTETKQIRDWNCTKYNQTVEMTGGKTTSEMWVTEDIKISQDLVKKFSAAFMAQNPGLKQLGAEMMREAEKIKGYVVYTSSQSKMMGQESRSTMEVVEMKEDTAPEGIYEVPAKFKKKKYE